MINIIRVLIILTVLSLSYANSNELITIAVVGNTEPIRTSTNTHQLKGRNFILNAKLSINKVYNIKTHQLTPGKVIPRKINLKSAITPIAIVGCDYVSIKWIDKFNVKLKSLGALGFVVNCNGKDDFDKLQQHSSIALMPVNGNQIYNRFKNFRLKNYPVLITHNFITQ